MWDSRTANPNPIGKLAHTPNQLKNVISKGVSRMKCLNGIWTIR